MNLKECRFCGTKFFQTSAGNIKFCSLKCRFEAKYEKRGKDECWEWTANCFTNGYGQFKGFGETRAHRVAYRLYVGDIREGFRICHRCDNPKCVNPKHLFQGTDSDNFQDMLRKGRGNKASGNRCYQYGKPRSAEWKRRISGLNRLGKERRSWEYLKWVYRF